jgi:transcriptional regulator with XRE-family HTH domain
MSNINEKIKHYRGIRGLTLSELANQTGFTKGYLSKIERTLNPPPFATVQLIAEALQVDVTELMDKHPDGVGSKDIDIFKASQLPADDWEASSLVYSFKPLVNLYKNKYMSPFLFRVAKGATEVTSHDSEEFVYVLEGSVELNYEGRTYNLEAGDCFYLDARNKHNFVNKIDQVAQLLAVHFNYRRF